MGNPIAARVQESRNTPLIFGSEKLELAVHGVEKWPKSLHLWLNEYHSESKNEFEHASVLNSCIWSTYSKASMYMSTVRHYSEF